MKSVKKNKMSSSTFTYEIPTTPPSLVKERDIEEDFIQKLVSLKYTHRPGIRDRAALEANFREKFNKLNEITLSDSEFNRLLDQITTPDVYKAAETLRSMNHFDRDDGTPPEFHPREHQRLVQKRF